MVFFVSVDGMDGGGKSTQIELLKEWFEQSDQEVLVVRDPGGTKLGEALRDILLHREEIPLSMHAEMLMYMASRAQLMAETVLPALEHERVVISDRFLLANVVYQGEAGGLPPEEIWKIGRIATQNRMPDLTVILDLSVEASQRRLTGPKDRLESRGEAYMERVRNGFLTQASELGDSCVIVDAEKTVEEVQKAILSAVSQKIRAQE